MISLTVKSSIFCLLIGYESCKWCFYDSSYMQCTKRLTSVIGD